MDDFYDNPDVLYFEPEVLDTGEKSDDSIKCLLTGYVGTRDDIADLLKKYPHTWCDDGPEYPGDEDPTRGYIYFYENSDRDEMLSIFKSYVALVK